MCGGLVGVCCGYMLGFLCFSPLRGILKLMFLAPWPAPPCCSAPASVRLASKVDRIQPRTASTRNTENDGLQLIRHIYNNLVLGFPPMMSRV